MDPIDSLEIVESLVKPGTKQHLQAVTNIEVPNHLVLVEKVQLNILLEQAGGVTGDMEWFMREINVKSPKTAKQKILWPFREELEPFTTYPEGSAHWKFLKAPMQKWIRENFKRWD